MVDMRDRNRRYEKVIGELTGAKVQYIPPKAFHQDGYVNMLNKYGTSQDTSEHYVFERDADVPDELLERFYEGNGLFSRIIDAPAEEALRTGFKMKNIDDEKLNLFVERSLDELNWEETAIDAIKWARLFGGSIIVLLVNDGRGIEEPLDWKHIESIDDMRLYDRSLIVPEYESMYSYEGTDPFKTRGSRLGMPEHYMINSRYGSFTVHESRCLIFQNGVLPENASTSIYQLWGMPEYIRINKAIRDAEVAAGSATKLLDRAVQAVYSMKDLSLLLSTEDGESQVLRRLEAIDLARGMMNTITIDSEGEDYSFRQFSFTGVSEVIDSTCNYLSALTNIPQTILFGRSPAGMSATGESDFENYYNYVQRIQKRMLRSNLRYLLGIIFQAGVTNGEVEKVPRIDVEFNPLWSMSDMEKEQLEQAKIATQTARAQAAQMYVSMNAMTAAEVRRALSKKDTFDVETMLDDEEEKELFPDGMPKYGEQPQGEQGAEGGENPMAALMGGGAPTEEGALSNGGEAEVEKPKGLPEGKPKGRPGGKPKGGNAMPDAPDATRLPQDQTPDAPEAPAPQGEIKAETVKRFQKDGAPCGVGVVVVKDGKILTGVRKSENGYGLLCGPGGKIEDGESPKEAAARELHEEFGVYPKDLIFIGRGKKDEESEFDPPFLFLCTEYHGEPKTDEFEMTRPRWRSVKEIKGLQCFKAFEDGVDVLCRFIGEVPDPEPKRRKKAYNFDKNKLTEEAQCVNMDAEEDTGWRTTDNNHKIHINEEGVADKGNPHVLEKVNGGYVKSPRQKDIEISGSGENVSCKSFARGPKGDDRGGQHYAEHILTFQEPIYDGMTKQQYIDHVEEMLRKPTDDRIWGFNGIEVDPDTGEEVEYIVRYDSKTHEFCKGYPGVRILTGFMAKYTNERTLMPDRDFEKKALQYYNENKAEAEASLKKRGLK